MAWQHCAPSKVQNDKGLNIKQSIISMFKILYIHTLPHPSFTADETEEPRRKEARYQSIMRILKDRQEYRFLDNTLSSTFYNAQTPLVSVSAIVGENGQGKSSLIELMLRLINNMAYALRPAYAQANRSHPRFIRGVYAEFSFELNGNVYIIRNEDLNICCRVNDEKIWQYDYTQRNDESHGLTNIKTALPATEQDVHRWLSDLFYTIVVNYSSYSYNTNDYFPEHIEDEELDKDETRDSVTEEERCWLCGIFHKNDGYQMPIVLNPFRANGQIDYNNEIDLLQTRIYLLAISNNSPLASIYKDKKPKSFVFDILTDFSPTGTHLFTSIKTRLEMYYLHYISDWRHADEHAMDILGKRIVEVWSKCVGLNLNKCCKSKDEGSIRRTLNYIVYKTIKISLTYAKYKRYQEDVKNVEEELNGESGIEAYIKQLYLDNTHITLKIKRAIAWLIFAHYSTTMTKDKQGERWVTDSEIPIFLFAKRVEDRLKNKSRYINGANKNVMAKRYPDLPLHEWTVEELLPAPSFRSDLRFSLLDEKGDNTGKVVSMRSFSSGEKHIAGSLFTALYHIYNLYTLWGESENKKQGIKYRFINLVFDEIELYFHPKYQTAFLKKLLDGINAMNVGDKIKGINIIISTHSPFVLSDIPNQNILCLESGVPKPWSSSCNTFCANVYDILNSGFFMEKFVGDFAESKYHELIDRIEKYGDVPMTKKELADIKGEINLIGDDYLRDCLREALYAKAGENIRLLEEKNRLEERLAAIDKQLNLS